MDKKAFFKKLDGIRDLPTLPEVALEINRLLDNPDTTITHVSDIINKDQAIVGKMLRLVNSSFFGLEAKVSTVSRAVIILGFNTVRNALISVSIIDSMKKTSNSAISFRDFWRHAISCAVVSKHLALRSRLAPPEEAFTAGIVHDIGKLVLAKYFPDEFGRIMEEVNSGRTFSQSEGMVLPVHHSEIGEYLARRWRLPNTICDAVKFSHNVVDPDERPVACIVHFANMAAHALNDMASDFVFPELPNGETAGALRAEFEKMDEWFQVAKSEIESACQMLLNGGP